MNAYQVKDYIYDASEDAKGIIVLEDIEAIENALKLWLMSFQGERIRRPDDGGYITKWLFKSIDEDTAFDIKNAIRIGLEREFIPRINIDKIIVDPDYTRESWRIEIYGYIPSIQKEVYVIENLRKQV